MQTNDQDLVLELQMTPEGVLIVYMVDKDSNERYICGQWGDQDWVRDFHLGFFALDNGLGCSSVVNKAWLFHSKNLQFSKMENKVPFDGHFSKIEAKEKIDQILKNHNFLKKKKKENLRASLGSQAILKNVLEGIQNYEGLIKARVGDESEKIDKILNLIKKEAWLMEALGSQLQKNSEKSDKNLDGILDEIIFSLK